MEGMPVSDEPALPPNDETAIYDTVWRPPMAAPESTAGEPVDSDNGQPPNDAARPPSLTFTVILLVALLVSSLVLLIAGLSLAAQLDAASAVVIASIALGGSLLIWHLQTLLRGSGRRTAMINRTPWVNLMVIAAFGVTTGFSLFDVLTGLRSAPRIAMLAAGLVGLVAALISYIRDTDLHDRGLLTVTPQAPVAVPASETKPAPQPQVFFDPAEGADELRPRGSWPQPRRGTAADASLWDDPGAEAQEPPRRARRAAD